MYTLKRKGKLRVSKEYACLCLQANDYSIIETSEEEEEVRKLSPSLILCC
jgi:hypothetical protein